MGTYGKVATRKHTLNVVYNHHHVRNNAGWMDGDLSIYHLERDYIYKYMVFTASIKIMFTMQRLCASEVCVLKSKSTEKYKTYLYIY